MDNKNPRPPCFLLVLDTTMSAEELQDAKDSVGQLVALLPEGETTLKTFYKEKDGRIRLQPANESFDPIIVDDCQIQGVVIGVLRRY